MFSLFQSKVGICTLIFPVSRVAPLLSSLIPRAMRLRLLPTLTRSVPSRSLLRSVALAPTLTVAPMAPAGVVLVVAAVTVPAARAVAVSSAMAGAALLPVVVVETSMPRVATRPRPLNHESVISSLRRMHFSSTFLRNCYFLFAHSSWLALSIQASMLTVIQGMYYFLLLIMTCVTWPSPVTVHISGWKSCSSSDFLLGL